MFYETLMGRHRIILLVLLSFVLPFLSYASIPEKNVPHLKKYIVKKYPGIPKQSVEKIALNANELSKKHNVDFSLVVAVIETESSFNPKAKYKGNVGLMQISYSTWKKHFGIERIDTLYKVEYNIDLGIRILKRYIKKNNGDVKRALRMYNGNANKSYVQKVFRHKERFESYRKAVG
jgi:soluble lytic murein transglycosylase-like protein